VTKAINESTLYGRLARGWPREKALSTPPRPNRIVTVKGKRQTVAQWARELGLAPNSIYSRLRRGWTEKEAVTVPLDNRCKARVLIVRGRAKTLKEWSRRTGIPAAAILRRLYAGWTPKDAISVPINMQFRNGRAKP
jgi:hypothetical protein